MTRVACLGETMFMLIPASQGPLGSIESFRRSFGGAESNVAIGLVNLGKESLWISRLGDDGFGHYIVEELQQRGVTVYAEMDKLRPTGIYFKEFTGGKTRVQYYRRGSAASAMSPSWFDDHLLLDVDILHISGITPALSPSCYELVDDLLTRRPHNISVSFDVNWRPALWPNGDPAPLIRLANKSDVLFVGFDEAAKLSANIWSYAGVRDVFSEPEILVVKDGSHSAGAFYADTRVDVSAVRVVGPQPDPVGAGDAFAAGFLSEYLDGQGITRALRLGHILGAGSLMFTEDIGYDANYDDVASLLELRESEWRNLTWTPTEPMARRPRP